MTISRLAVFGRPISHSLSPALFEPALRDHSPDSFYIRVTGLHFPTILSFADRIGIQFANITHPFKEAAANLPGIGDKEVARTRAANGLRWLDGHIQKWNTDPDGVRNSFLSEWGTLANKSIMVLGAGGAGRAAVDALVQSGARVHVWNRTRSRLQQVCSMYPEVIPVNTDMEEALISRMDGFVWTIPGYPHFLGRMSFSPYQVVLDANYRPHMLKNHDFSPAKRIDGKQWLVGQAAVSMERLGLNVPDLHELRRRADADRPATPEKKALALIGFMGAGKTTVGRMLAGETDRFFADLDTLVEQQDGRCIPDIFEQSGENCFRKLEVQALQGLGNAANHVIATGGGVLSNPEAVRWLRKHAVCIWLYRPLNLLKEIAGTPEAFIRPLLREDAVDQLFNERIIRYAQQADLVIVSDRGDGPDDIAGLLMQEPIVQEMIVPPAEPQG